MAAFSRALKHGEHCGNRDLPERAPARAVTAERIPHMRPSTQLEFPGSPAPLHDQSLSRMHDRTGYNRGKDWRMSHVFGPARFSYLPPESTDRAPTGNMQSHERRRHVHDPKLAATTAPVRDDLPSLARSATGGPLRRTARSPIENPPLLWMLLRAI